MRRRIEQNQNYRHLAYRKEIQLYLKLVGNLIHVTIDKKLERNPKYCHLIQIQFNLISVSIDQNGIQSIAICRKETQSYFK